MRLKRLNQRRIFDPARRLVSLSGASGLHRRAFSLPPARRNARLAFGLPQGA
jgi:hypothetical protein